MKIAVCYVCVTHGPISGDYASRFVSTFHEFPPQYPCDVIVCCNGGPLKYELALMFAPLHAKFFPRENDLGWDVTAFQDAAAGPCATYDAILFCGESVSFFREGWLKRLVEAMQKHGPGFYGFFGSFCVRAHLQTTCFCCPPWLLKLWPGRPQGKAQRFSFEHGPNALWRRAERAGYPVKLVTWDGEWDPLMWRIPSNIIWRGNQSNCLLRCNHTDQFVKAGPRTKASWAKLADQPFK